MNKTPKFSINHRLLGLIVLGGIFPISANGAPTELADAPVASGVISATTVKPNIAFILDDSGSMDDENMPDANNTNKSNRCWGWHGYNKMFYNPGYTYKPPYKPDGAVYSDGVTRYPDASFTAARKDGFFPLNGQTFTGNSGTNTNTNLSTLANLTPNTVSCDTVGSSGGFGATATITVTGTGSTSVSNILVGATDIFSSGSTTSSTSTSTVASRIAAKITLAGYSATASGNVVTIQAPYSAGNIVATPNISKSGTMVISATAFSGYTPNTDIECPSSPSKYYYSTHKTNPNSDTCDANTSYDIMTNPDRIEAPGIPNVGRTAAHIAAAQTNYANWYTYYRKRIQLMKSATGEAFKDLTDKYRVGAFFMNSVESGADQGTPNNDLIIDDFSGSTAGTHRHTWYDKIYTARGVNTYTPTRGALSRAGRIFAGQIPGFDPVQYSCQQNFAILSSDGYWNTQAESSTYGPFNIAGSNIGDVDFPSATAASATSFLQLPSSMGCYRAFSILANGTELLDASPVPASCTSTVNTFGNAIADSINAATGTTGYTAVYTNSNRRITITAPASLGNITFIPSRTFTKTSGTTTSFNNFSAFSGGITGVQGAPLPYADNLKVANTLADVAYYYYTTDLRTPLLGNCSNTIGGTTYNNLCDNNVLGSGKDINSQQHMTTFTVGLGVSGTVFYENNYETAPNIAGVTQYYDIANGSANWPNPGSGNDQKIDDLWHAAVNGRGTYYSANNAEALKEGIQSALSGIQARQGSSAAAATSNLEPVAGDNFVFVALYRTVKWDGDLKSFTIDPDTGVISGSELWSAQAELATTISAASAGNDNRTIKYFSASGTNNLKDFTLANLTADSLATHFTDVCDKLLPGGVPIDQCGADFDDLDSTKRGIANQPDNLIKFLRGQTTHEDESTNAIANNRVYRARDFAFGDIVNAVPVYMKAPPFGFGTYDTTYTTFQANKANRAGTVFAAANDGMLHAINAENGQERWTFIPSQALSSMWKLADRNYPNAHQYLVDGSPTIADVCADLDSGDSSLCDSANDWKTILVAGLNKGGCGYYALDVTDPTAPKGLWEFTHPHLGYSYGNPVIAKLKSGQWVVIFTSGYNNIPGHCGGSGDGNGRVYVVDALTGTLIDEIQTYTSGATPAGTAGTPSGLGKLNVWIANADVPVIDRAYAGDLLGNLWRIDLDDNYGNSGKEATLLATLKDGNDIAQPISTKPEVAEVQYNGTNYPVVMVGTGKYLSANDASDHNQQSLYAIKDSLGSSGISNIRGASMEPRTMTETTGSAGGTYEGRTIRTMSGNTVNWATQDGWYMDLNPGNSSPGERVNVDMSLQFNLLTVAANVPSTNICDVGGYGFLYFIDINTGKYITSATDNAVGVRLPGNALVAGIKTVKLQSGKTVTIVTDTGGNVMSEENPDISGGGGANARRTMWREIAD